MGISVFPAPSGGAKEKRIDSFTASGSWVVPSGVTYAIAHIIAGGGGVGTASSGDGGNSSVDFPVTVTALGGRGNNISSTFTNISAKAGRDNSGHGAIIAGEVTISFTYPAGLGASMENGSYIVSGSTVTPATTVTITVGAGGAAGTSGAAGGSGYVWIEYYE